MRERIRFQCPFCEAALTAKPTGAGKILDCPKCQSRVRVPEPEDVAALRARDQGSDRPGTPAGSRLRANEPARAEKRAGLRSAEAAAQALVVLFACLLLEAGGDWAAQAGLLASIAWGPLQDLLLVVLAGVSVAMLRMLGMIGYTVVGGFWGAALGVRVWYEYQLNEVPCASARQLALWIGLPMAALFGFLGWARSREREAWWRKMIAGGDAKE